MKRSVLFASLYAAFGLGSVLTCFFGSAGVGNYRALENYVRTLRENIVELEARNRELAEDLRLLQTDEETVALLARGLGYLREGERRLFISSYTPPGPSHDVGFVVEAPPASASGAPRLDTVFLVPLLALFVALCVRAARAGDDG